MKKILFLVFAMTLLVAGLAIVPSLVSAQQGGIAFYFYDSNGRLSSVVWSSGEVARYQYDAAGNLIGISRTPTPSAITNLSPTSGPVNTLVTITGNGFGPTVNDNTVLFNGEPSEILSASTTQIVAKVPAAATTGPVAVIMATSAAISTPFTVTLPTTGLTITGFTPSIGTPNTPVTITGTNFETTPFNNALQFNVSNATVNTATETTLTTAVPVGATSGRIKVTTPSGSAVSSQDFFVPPAPRTPSDVEFTGRMAVGETRTVTIATNSKIGLMVFDATAGQKVSVLVGTSSLLGNISLLSTSGTTLGISQATSGSFIDARTLPVTGTYTLVIAPFVGRSGSVTFTLYDVSTDASATITPGGPPVTVPVAKPGQNVTLTFDGTAGERVSTFIAALPGTSSVSLISPAGSVLATDSTGNVSITLPATLFIDVQQLVVTGTYKIVINPAGPFTSNVTCTLYDVPADVTGSISPGGPTINIANTVPGQNARLTFDGTAGQNLSFQTTNHPDMGVEVTFIKPDQTVLKVSLGASFDSTYLEQIFPPVDGTYTIILNPSREGVGSITCRLYVVPPDVTGSLTPGGPPVSLTTTIPGQNAQLTFNTAPEQRVSLLITYSGAPGQGFAFVLLEQSGSLRIQNSNVFGSTFIDPFTLQNGSAGSFTLTLNPSFNSVGTFTTTLYDVPPDVTGSITPGGPPVPVTLATPGQNARLTFDGVAGQKVSLKASGSGGFLGEIRILRSNNNTLVGGTLTAPAQELFLDTIELPTDDTYTVFINPTRESTGSKTISLYSVTDLTGTIEVGGAPVTVNLTTPGQIAELTFTATDQMITIHATNNITGCVTVALIGPGGDGFTGVFSCDAGVSFDLETLDLFAATYKVRIDPQGASIGSVTISITSP